MKFFLNIDEASLLSDLEFGCLQPDWYNEQNRVLSLTGTEVRDLIMQIFDCLPLLNDENDRQIICNLGWRLTNNCL